MNNQRSFFEQPRALALVFTAAVALSCGGPILANTIDVAPGEVAVSSNGVCSLREAIDNAENDSQYDNTDCTSGSGADTINLAAGSTYTIDEGLPTITTTIVINGNGSTIERDAGLTCNFDRVHDAGEFRILDAYIPDLTLNDLTLANGCADGKGDDGGAILIAGGTLTLNRVTVRNNYADDKSGGLDTTATVVTIVDSTFTDNTAGRGGGAIGNGAGSDMTIRQSLIANNESRRLGGGGIGNYGRLTIVNSTIANNQDTGSTGGGGGIGSYGPVEIDHCTIVGNGSTGGLGGGGLGNSGTMTVKNSIVAGSTAGGDCVDLGTMTADGVDFDTDGTCSGFTQVTTSDLALGPLQDNGGPTATFALLPGSVAIDAAPDCTLVDGSTPVTQDQRGITRPQGLACDVGAFELASAQVPTLGWPFALLLASLLAAVATWRLRT